MFLRVLIGITDRSSADDVSSLLSSTGVDLLISRVLRPTDADAAERAQSIQRLYSSHNQTKLAWSLGGRAEGHLASLVGPAMVKLHQLLLLTLPGTPVFNYGDEIGLMDEVSLNVLSLFSAVHLSVTKKLCLLFLSSLLQDNKFPKMLWDSDEELNGTLQVNNSYIQFK